MRRLIEGLALAAGVALVAVGLIPILVAYAPDFDLQNSLNMGIIFFEKNVHLLLKLVSVIAGVTPAGSRRPSAGRLTARWTELSPVVSTTATRCALSAVGRRLRCASAASTPRRSSSR